MKVLLRIDPNSTAKVAACLGVLWALLGWFFSGIVIAIVLWTSEDVPTDLPPLFPMGGLLASVIGGVAGGAVSGYLGSFVYNMLTRHFGGIRVELRDEKEKGGSQESFLSQ